MRRRSFLILLGGAAAAWPLAAQAQVAGKVWRIGVLGGSPLPVLLQAYSGFLQGMRELGYIEGKDFVSELRVADNSYERLPGLADELVRIGVDILLAGTSAEVLALQNATRTIPIVMAGIADPVGNGFIASLAQPGGNTTGVSANFVETAPKQLELLAAMLPNPSRIGLLGNPEQPSFVPFLRSVREAAGQARLQLVTLEARNAQEVENAFAAFGSQAVQAVLVAGFSGMRPLLIEQARQRRLPTMFNLREFVQEGGLMSYGEDDREFYRRTATYVHKLMRGAKPTDLPVELPTRYHLTINRKTADALGITIPPLLYIFADEVIE
jgi:putative tryptophan/tyrosine transport system substrate-binding protein